jgi:predicted acylesterase/phospholipase RssA
MFHPCLADHRSLVGTKVLVERFVAECVQAIDAVASAPDTKEDPTEPAELPPVSAKEKLDFFEGARLAMGRTALCLSGGGSLAMYHMGVVKALLQHDCMPRIVSGTSGGSIVAGMLAIKTDREMLEDVVTPDIADKYGVTWFDPLWTQVGTFAQSLLTADRPYVMTSERFAHTCRRYYGSWTFGEAFRRTGRVVSIAITVRYAGSHASASAAHPFLANYLTCPNVYIWSAVAASCALPGLMPSTTLVARPTHIPSLPSPRQTDSSRPSEREDPLPSPPPSSRWSFSNLLGFQEPRSTPDPPPSADEVSFYPRGVDNLDGSMHSDIPCDALARMFHTNRYITSQVNPHIAPFLREDHHSFHMPSHHDSPDADGSALSSASSSIAGAGGGGFTALMTQVRLWLTLDIQYRTQRLARLRLLPRFFGADLGGIFLQRYRGHVTIAPRMNLLDQFKALSHPSREDMVKYIHEGELSVWPHLAHIRTLVSAEKALSKAVKTVRPRAAAEVVSAHKMLHVGPFVGSGRMGPPSESEAGSQDGAMFVEGDGEPTCLEDLLPTPADAGEAVPMRYEQEPRHRRTVRGWDEDGVAPLARYPSPGISAPSWARRSTSTVTPRSRANSDSGRVTPRRHVPSDASELSTPAYRLPPSQHPSTVKPPAPPHEEWEGRRAEPVLLDMMVAIPSHTLGENPVTSHPATPPAARTTPRHRTVSESSPEHNSGEQQRRNWRQSLAPHVTRALLHSPGGKEELRRSRALTAAAAAKLTAHSDE